DGSDADRACGVVFIAADNSAKSGATASLSTGYRQQKRRERAFEPCSWSRPHLLCPSDPSGQKRLAGFCGAGLRTPCAIPVLQAAAGTACHARAIWLRSDTAKLNEELR